MKTTLALHTFLCDHLKKPTKDLFEKAKKGRGIYRRIFFYIPAHGEGYSDHSQDEYEKLDGSIKLNQVRITAASTEEVDLLEVRGRSCHQCDNCWSVDVAELV